MKWQAHRIPSRVKEVVKGYLDGHWDIRNLQTRFLYGLFLITYEDKLTRVERKVL